MTAGAGTRFEAYDLVVVGAGLAGSVGAARAASLGRRVLLLDAAADPSGGGNSAMSWGSLHVATVPMTAPVGQLRRRIETVTGGQARPDLAEAMAASCGRALAWLLWYGVRVEEPTATRWKAILAPIRAQDDPVHAWPGRGPQLALRRLQLVLVSLGGEVLAATRARELVRDGDGRVSGVVTAGGRLIRARAVLLADGGFQSNPELRKRHLGPAADRIFIRGGDSNQGDGLVMGEAAGAKLVHMQSFYGRCLHRDALTNDRLWPMPFLDDLLTFGIVVDVAGRRLVDEALGGIVAANVVARTADPRGASVVLDERTWRAAHGRAGYSGSGGADQPPANPEIERRGGVIHRDADVRGLARRAGIDPDGLARTVREYSAAASAGTAAALAVPRTGAPRPLEGLLLAIPLIPSVTFTMGGLLTDADGRVLDVEERRIAGLYAAGGTASGLQGSLAGGTAASYVGGLAIALVFGLLAAEAVARETAAL